MNRRNRTARVAAATLLALAGLLVVVEAPVTAAPAKVAPDVLAAAQGLLARNPGIGLAEAIRRIDQGPARVSLIRQVYAEHPDTFGGSWYDPATGVQHLRATTTAAAAGMAKDAARAGVASALHPAEYSYRQLSQEAERINSGVDATFGPAGKGHASVDARANRTVVELPAGALRKSAPPAGPVILGVAPPAGNDDACTAFTACGIPMRTGIGLESSVSPCSLGFTATAGDNSHWVLTAGHCGHEGTGFWHGEQNIGLMRIKTEDTIDVGRVRISNSYWLAGSFGWIYNVSAPNSPVPLNDYARSMVEIQYGEYVCLVARYSTSGTTCGPITSANMYRTRVAADGCGGDSGGGWYLPGGGVRIAYGTHEGSDDNCHAPGGFSWFSPVPTIHSWLDFTSDATVRIDTR